MPHYFFHLMHPDRAPVRDDEGIAFEDDATARREGMASLGEMIEEASSSQPMPFCVSVQIVREGEVIALLTGHLSFRTRPSPSWASSDPPHFATE